MMGIEIRNIVYIFNISARKKTAAMLMFNARRGIENYVTLGGPVSQSSSRSSWILV
jgi:hypothetical protein